MKAFGISKFLITPQFGISKILITPQFGIYGVDSNRDG
jgi:hypothetical protein